MTPLKASQDAGDQNVLEAVVFGPGIGLIGDAVFRMVAATRDHLARESMSRALLEPIPSADLHAAGKRVLPVFDRLEQLGEEPLGKALAAEGIGKKGVDVLDLDDPTRLDAHGAVPDRLLEVVGGRTGSERDNLPGAIRANGISSSNEGHPVANKPLPQFAGFHGDLTAGSDHADGHAAHHRHVAIVKRHDIGRDAGADEGVRAQMTLEEGMSSRRVARRHRFDFRVIAPGQKLFTQHVAMIWEDVLLRMAAVPRVDPMEFQSRLGLARRFKRLGGKAAESIRADKGDATLLRRQLLEGGDRLSVAFEQRHEGPASDVFADLRIDQRIVPAFRLGKVSAAKT